ncbi:MAG: hypothetical protein AAFO61_11040 [Pseudomonadota bacterium]
MGQGDKQEKTTMLGGIYGEDSFLTLTGPERATILALGVIMAWLCLWWSTRMGRGLIVPARLAIALFVFALFVWLSPQVYYTFYMRFFSLPLQPVIGWPPSPAHYAEILTFTGRANLSAHSQGVLGWLLILASLLNRTKEKRASVAHLLR